MRTPFTILVIVVFQSSAIAQFDKLITLEKTYSKKVQLGMSTDQVRNSLGPPKAIEAGFPSSSESIVADFPEQKGQLNNSTWFYIYSPVSVVVDEYYLNTYKVSKELHDAYQGIDTIYFRDGRIITPNEAAFSGGICAKNIVRMRKSIDPEFTGPRKSKKNLQPILCIVFDRGTQVVATTKMFFRLLSP